jgi:hypothetical protein
MHNRRISSPILYVLIFLLALVLTLALTHPAAAHEFGPGFKFNITNPRVENRQTSYGTYISSAVNDYRTNTNKLRPIYVTSSPSVIIYIQGNYGATNWAWGTLPYYQGTQCVTWPGLSPYWTGRCADAHLFDFAYIYINTACPTPGGCTMPHYLARHELGHAFGLGHVSEVDCPSQYWSIMLGGFCRPNVPTTLQQHDKNDLNTKYP